MTPANYSQRMKDLIEMFESIIPEESEEKPKEEEAKKAEEA